jgi:transcriptional regulator with XRE-family HTH domain
MPRIIDGEKNNIVGQQVRYFRKKRKYSQKELSIRLETLAIYVCRGSISRIEDGSRTVTDIELFGLASVLGTSIESFFPPFAYDSKLPDSSSEKRDTP